MAEDEKDDKNLAEDGAKSGKKGMLFIIIGVVLLLGGGGAAFFLMGGEPPPADNGEGADVVVQEQKAEPDYLSLDPPLVVNFEQSKRARFLQVTLDVMARKRSVLDDVKTHMPVIRNNLNLLLSAQDYKLLGTREGKEKLRQDILLEIQNVLQERTGEPGIEDVYFTSFVMQ